MKLKTLLIAAALSSACASAYSLTVTTSPVSTDSNVVRNPCGLDPATGVGTTIFGCLNNIHAQLVQFTSDESIVYNGGQASIAASDALFSRISISLDGSDQMSVVELNIDATVNGFVTFSDGIDTSAPFALDDGGQNRFGIFGPFDTLTFVTYVGTLANLVETDIVADLKQVRLSEQTAVIPEPETYALMLAGLGALGFVARRRKQRQA